MNGAIDRNESGNEKPFENQSQRQMDEEEPAECTELGDFGPVPNGASDCHVAVNETKQKIEEELEVGNAVEEHEDETQRLVTPPVIHAGDDTLGYEDENARRDGSQKESVTRPPGDVFASDGQ